MSETYTLVFQDEFRQDLKWWVKNDHKINVKIFDLIESVSRTPFDGIGKPEPLKFLGAGIWSRRITQEYRPVYRIDSHRIDFLQCRYHY